MADEGKDQASQSPAKARPIKERFDNAVKVIRSLPKEGKIWSISTRPLIISRGYSLHARIAPHGPLAPPTISVMKDV